jgi:hypothetical protein
METHHTHKVHWIAGLSNGETAHEGKGNFQIIEGELSPWQRLLRHIETNSLRITSLSLGTDDGRRWNLPSAGKNPKFHAFATAPRPTAYRMFRSAAMDVMDGSGEWGDLYTCAEAEYENGTKMQVWVAEDTLAAWSVLTA